MIHVLDAMRSFADSKKILFPAGAVYLVSQMAIGAILHPLGIGDVIRMQSTLSSVAMGAVLDRWDAAGQTGRFISHFYPDFLHPLWYGILLTALMARTFNGASIGRRWNIALVLPCLAAVMDLLENCLHVSFVINRGNLSDLTAAVAGTASLLKWSLAGSSMAVIAGAFVRGKFFSRPGESG